MNHSAESISRLTLFIAVTVMELLLVVFLLLYGTSLLKFSAIFLLLAELFAVYQIYFYILEMLKPKLY